MRKKHKGITSKATSTQKEIFNREKKKQIDNSGKPFDEHSDEDTTGKSEVFDKKGFQARQPDK